MATREEIQQARQADLPEYLQAKGVKLKKAGQDWRIPDHGGLLIQKNMYWHASTGSGGNSLDFLVEIERIPFPEAVRELGGYFSSRKAFQRTTGCRAEKETKLFSSFFSPPCTRWFSFFEWSGLSVGRHDCHTAKLSAKQKLLFRWRACSCDGG